MSVGVGVNVPVGDGTAVSDAVAGCGSGRTMVGKTNSEVGVAYVPHNEGVWPQEDNNIVAMKNTGMKRLT